MNGLLPLVVAGFSVPLWCLFNYLAMRIHRKKKESGLTPNVEKSDIVGNGTSFLQRDQTKAQSDTKK
jgi:hypothetical protein